jgi:hypothetical protein
MASINMDELYRDQAAENFRVPGYQFFSVYTPVGIQRIDARFCKRIQAFKRGESFTERDWRGDVEQVWADTHESLKKDIEENPHLHKDIKANLLFNLNQ